jgi:hypothetical protein
MRRKLLKALSLMLGTVVASSAHAQDMDDVVCEYGVMPYEPIPEPEPVPPYGIEEPIYLPDPAPGLVVNGVVQQAVTGQPLEGIRVSYGAMELLTGADGRFSFTLPATEQPLTELVFEATDIDGKDHGGKHKGAKVEVELVDGALSPMVAEQGLILTMQLR